MTKTEESLFMNLISLWIILSPNHGQSRTDSWARDSYMLPQNITQLHCFSIVVLWNHALDRHIWPPRSKNTANTCNNTSLVFSSSFFASFCAKSGCLSSAHWPAWVPLSLIRRPTRPHPEEQRREDWEQMKEALEPHISLPKDWLKGHSETSDWRLCRSDSMPHSLALRLALWPSIPVWEHN